MRRITTALSTMTWTLALLIGLPTVLVATVGWPLPHRVPTRAGLTAWAGQPRPQLTHTVILNGMGILGWLLWAGLLATVLATVYGHLIRICRALPRWHLPGPMRSLSAAMLGTVAVSAGSTALAPAAAHAAVAVDTTPHQPGHDLRPSPGRTARTVAVHKHSTVRGSAQSVTGHGAHTDGGHSEPGAPGWAQDAPGGIHRVVKGDNLWDIAKHELGDPYRWRDIYVLNRGKPQFNGYSLADPDEIHIGWVLMLPARTPAPPAGTAGGTPAPTNPPPQVAPPATSPPALPVPAPSTPASPAPAAPSPSAPASTPVPSPNPGSGQPAPQPSADHSHDEQDASDRDGAGHGVSLPSQGWISLGLAASIAAVAALLRLQRRRSARLHFPIPLKTGPAPSPVPASVRTADMAGRARLAARDAGSLPGLVPAAPTVPAPIGIDASGGEISLFALPGPAVALDGPGAPAAARAVLAAVLTTGVADELPTRPTVVAPAELLAALLPPGTHPAGLDPAHVTFDGERLLVVLDTSAAITHLEEEMIHRRRLLNNMGVDSVAELNAGTRHLEFLPPYVLLAPTDPRYSARLLAVASHRGALHLYPVLLGAAAGVPGYEVAADGTVTTAPPDAALDGGRLATLSPRDLADVLAMVARVAPRPETGDAPTADEPGAPDTDPATADPPIELPLDRAVELPEPPQPRADDGSAPPVQLRVLGMVTLATEAGPISISRTGSRAVLAVLAALPRGRTFEEMAAAIHPNADPDSGVNRVRTDLNAVRTLLRDATGIEGRGKFIVYDSASSRYRIDPNLIDVDLWRMLAALDRANKAGDDQTCLAALRDAVDYYTGDFGESQDWPWSIDYATTYRHQLLSAYARIAEILEADHPDQAIAALEAAIDYDPVNEELYQRIIRIHGRLARPDAVRRTLGLLENRLADLGQAEPSEATRRIAERQLKPAYTTRTPT